VNNPTASSLEEVFEIPTVYLSTDLVVLTSNEHFRELFDLHQHQSLQDELTPSQCQKVSRKLARSGKADAVITSAGKGIPFKLSLRNCSEGVVGIAIDASAELKAETKLAEYSRMIEAQNRRIKHDQARVELLLENTLPSKIISELRSVGFVRPRKFQDVGVLVLDFVGFTSLSAKADETLLFKELNWLFTAFDSLAEKHNCERVKTIGDAYLAVTNMNTGGAQPYADIACLAMDIITAVSSARTELKWQCRIGLHTGNLVAGVVGKTRILYDIFGDGVNTAFRMESMSEPMKATCSQQFVDACPVSVSFDYRGAAPVKGKGVMELYQIRDSASKSSKADIAAIVETASQTRSILAAIDD
jgi:class 3 adenylate cyclase